jgi:hypothetical protein
MNNILKIAKVFSKTPGPRSVSEGEFSGEQFRKEHLYPQLQKAINENQKLTVDLDGTEGYGRSFLDEAFGGLIIENDIEKELIDAHLVLISKEEPYLKSDIEKYLNNAQKRKIPA